MIDFRKEQIMCRTLGVSLVESAVALKLQVSGQAAIEGDFGKLLVLYSAYPNGDFIIWFLNKGYYSLMALVNKKMKHLITFPAHEMELFQNELTKLQLELGK